MAAKVKNTRASGEAIWTAELEFGTVVGLPVPAGAEVVLAPVLVGLLVEEPPVEVVAFDAAVEEGAALLVALLTIELTKDETEAATEETDEDAAADWDDNTEETEETAEETTEETEEAVAPPINWN